MHADREIFRRVFITAAVVLGAAASVTALTACNTTEGVGEDIGAAGDAIDDAAEDAND